MWAWEAEPLILPLPHCAPQVDSHVPLALRPQPVGGGFGPITCRFQIDITPLNGPQQKVHEPLLSQTMLWGKCSCGYLIIIVTVLR